jgi:hypothetical protein
MLLGFLLVMGNITVAKCQSVLNKMTNGKCALSMPVTPFLQQIFVKKLMRLVHLLVCAMNAAPCWCNLSASL